MGGERGEDQIDKITPYCARGDQNQNTWRGMILPCLLLTLK